MCKVFVYECLYTVGAEVEGKYKFGIYHTCEKLYWNSLVDKALEWLV